MLDSLEVKVLYQPDGGVGLAKRKGLNHTRREARPERSVKQGCELMNKERIEAYGGGRASQ
jgi:hypothetical protein